MTKVNSAATIQTEVSSSVCSGSVSTLGSSTNHYKTRGRNTVPSSMFTINTPPSAASANKRTITSVNSENKPISSPSPPSNNSKHDSRAFPPMTNTHTNTNTNTQHKSNITTYTRTHTTNAVCASSNAPPTQFTIVTSSLGQVPAQTNTAAETKTNTETRGDSASRYVDPLNTRLQPILRLPQPIPSSPKDLLIKTRKRAWKRLPVPDLDLILAKLQEQSEVLKTSNFLEIDSRSQRTGNSARDSDMVPAFPLFDSNTPGGPRLHEAIGSRRSVKFHQIHIREYDQTLGDNPCVSYGPAISLDWEFEEMEPCLIDDYEEFRLNGGTSSGSSQGNCGRRSVRQMTLNYYQRKNILVWTYGFDENQLQTAAFEAVRIQRQRALTKFFLPLSRVEELFGSLKRKTLRIWLIMKKNKSNDNDNDTQREDGRTITRLDED
eukprot:CAMPEP_0202446092 /NCGR_PEP_ID=MMETSP1360-20130828/4720_1 /ASSEMBLY_ACC=CAM_ASM_000848 /TAXON_ID=515479 /ORGANISM="Licmophora paradoxa, Strain CCMP2313" /LENGTH=434 /DNA_ID=CAMNT_0049062525 /DNA_START=125 /DNA_END=1429 /DNA_ORIENTATION=-